MIKFVNAKINIGLSIVGKRHDGYHLLETCFFPIGKMSGTPLNPSPFGDILELSDRPGPELGNETPRHSEHGLSYVFTGNKVDCEPQKNLVVKAGNLFAEEWMRLTGKPLREAIGDKLIMLFKSIPDGAGIGGGSADATFTLRILNDCCGNPFSGHQLESMAVRLGADCPVFVKNEPVFAEGIGEIFSPVESQSVRELADRPYWLLLVKPDIHISTREAFAGIKPKRPEIPLREALRLPISQWRDLVVNDFENSLFPSHPILRELKDALYASGALYASMSGSGAALYGIYPTHELASQAHDSIDAFYKVVIRL